MKKLLLILSLALISGLAQAKTYKVFVGTPAGSGADVQTRKLFTEVSKETGDTFVVVNKPGANFVVSYNAFLEDAKGGNSAIMFSPTALQLALHDRNETFEGKGLVVLHKINYFVATRSDSTIKTAGDIKNLNIGSAFAVSELLVKQYFSDNNVIPYKSDNEATMALLKGEVPALSTNSMNNALVANADKIKVINAFPQNVVGMSAYAVNKEFPEAERTRLNEAINKVIKGDEFKTWLKSVFSLNVEGGPTARYDELNNRLLGELFKVKK